MATKTGKNSRPARRFLSYAGVVCVNLISLVAFLCFFSARWYVQVYGRIGFDSVLYTLTSSLSGTQSSLISKYLSGAALPALATTIVVSILLFFPRKKLRKFSARRTLASCISLILSLALVIHAAFNVQLVDYIIAMSSSSEIYQEQYRDPKNTQITFPEEKRNLIYIMLESMETSYLSKEQGGALDYNLIPELYDLAQNNINFSHNDGVGGFREVSGTSWTIGAMVGHTSGVPLKVPDGISDWQNGYGKDGHFLPGLSNLQTVLKENGYYQALMVGSNAAFGGRKTYYDTHGVDKIYDLYSARKDGLIPKDYFVWWGMEDLYLFEYAKQALSEISQQEQPFAFTMLTVDTHHVGGYACAYCDNEHEENYENVISCSSRQVAAFLQWLQTQDFYENTTIIITGDHCSMDKEYFSRNVDENYSRHIYNCFINSAATPYETKNRQFSALDMFPTTLAAMGCAIEGDRLGLGVNLFSNQPTLMERMGYNAFYDELAKKSDFYAANFYAKEDLVPST